MTNLKFRAWDKQDKKIIYFDLLDYTGFLYDLYSSNEQGEDMYIVQQSTGLFDKNGVEIYEGDIIQMEQEFIAPVVFNLPQASFDLKHPKGYHGHWGLTSAIIDACNYKIIGNIFENPNILKG